MNNSNPLSYPCVATVIKYLEANLRIQLSWQCKSIRPIEKKTPLITNFLKLRDNCITINQTRYQLQKTLPEEIKVLEKEDEILNDVKKDHPLTIPQFYKVKVGNYIERVVTDQHLHDVWKFMIDKLLGGRPNIRTYNFCIIRNFSVLHSPRNLKISTKHVHLENPETWSLISSVQSLLDSESLPLSSFTISGSIPNVPRFEFDFVQSAEVLIFQGATLTEEHLLNLRHKKVRITKLHEDSYLYYILSLIKHWLDHGRDIGTRCSFGNCRVQKGRLLLTWLRKQYNAVDAKWLDGNCVILPIDNFSEIVVSFYEGLKILEMKVQRRAALLNL